MDPVSVIGLAASILDLLKLPGKTVELIALGKSNPGLREQIREHVEHIRDHLETLQAGGGHQDVFEQSQRMLQHVKSILESTEQPSTCCSRCPTIMTTIWDCVRSSRVRKTLDEAQKLLDTLLKEVILTAVSRVSRSIAVNPPELPLFDIGLDRSQEILDFLKEDGVRVVAIHVPGGLGKTTLLHKTLDELRKGGAFSKLAFVEVGENPDSERVKTLQSSILESLGGGKKEMPSFDTGKGALRDHLRHLKTSNTRLCLAIDNLWDGNDLERLLPHELASILPLLLITTRSLSVVEKLDELCSSPSNSSGSRDQVHKLKSYKPEELSPKESENLFREHASIKFELTDEHLPLVNAIVPLCGGLPLAGKVLGSLFVDKRRREVGYWKDVERRIRLNEEKLPSGTDKVFAVLQLSYDKLNLEARKAFLDVAHFFQGWEWHAVKHIVGDVEMEELENSSLLTRVEGWTNNPCREGSTEAQPVQRVRIHDLIIRLGKDVAQNEDLKYLIGKSFLDSILHDAEELNRVRGLWLWNSSSMIDANNVKRMQNLRVLHLERSALHMRSLT